MTRTVLLVSPAFHGYWQAFQAALEELGLLVTTHRYDTSFGVLGKVRNAAAHRFPTGRWRELAERSATDRAIAALREVRPDALLIVKGDSLDHRWWDAVQASGATTVTWLYDELANMRYSSATLAEAGAVLSYSPSDVQKLRADGIDAGHLPDGFDSLTTFRPHRIDAVSFVGARYPERERVLRMLRAAGVAVVAHGREWSRHPWDVVRTGRWRSARVPSGRDLTRSDYYGLMAGSLATLNIHGTGHEGLSMRTFEAPGVGALSLIDRADVARYYEVGTETLVFSSDDELLDHLRRASRDRAWAQGIRDAGARRTAAEHTLVRRMAEVKRLWG